MKILIEFYRTRTADDAHAVLGRETVEAADLDEARGLVGRHPHLRAVTRDGDLVGAEFATGGSSSAPSLIEVQAALEATTEQLDASAHTAQRLAFELNRLEQERHERACAATLTPCVCASETTASISSFVQFGGESM